MTDQMIAAPIDIAIMLAYFMAVVGFGLLFGSYAHTTRDFFFGGQRFAWWLIAFSGVATTIGSYSFVKYSAAGYSYGISSSQAYMNDWFWIPLLIFVWLPIIYFMRIQSVPEYFERRFGRTARFLATLFILTYLISYVGVNLLTLGKAFNALMGWPVLMGAIIACITVTLYVFAGGQTSVIMTDLAQGLTLLVVGVGVFLGGIWHFGGFTEFWSLLPVDHRHYFSKFNSPDSFSFIGIFGQDGLSNTAAFMLMNQGMIMRFLAMRSVRDARRMAIFWILVLYPIAAITVSGGGWIAKALVAKGDLAPIDAPDAAFVQAAHYLCAPGIFGFVLAALIAALMSTADTLINAVSSIFVNDIYRPYLRPLRDDRHYLRAARAASLSVALIGLALVPLFDTFKSVYQAHAWVTAAIPPPCVAAILLGLFWRRFNTTGAVFALAGGGLAMIVSMIPGVDKVLLTPFAFGMGEKSFDFVRAFYGLAVSFGFGAIGALFGARPRPEQLHGLINGEQLNAMRFFKGGEPNRRPGRNALLTVELDSTLDTQEIVLLPSEAMTTLDADPGDLVYVCDRRWWLGGLHSIHTRAARGDLPSGVLRIGFDAAERAHFQQGDRIYVEKIV
jgi:SSS family solute:Na+ symporter